MPDWNLTPQEKGDTQVKQLFLVISLVLLIMLSFAACAAETETTDEYTGENDFFTITGEIIGETEFSVAELMEKHPSEIREITRDTDEGEEKYPIEGVLLDEILNELDIAVDDLDGIRFEAGDGYAVDVPEEVLKENDIILAYEIDGEPLYEDSRPLRAFIPEEESLYWVKNLVNIELSQEEETASEVEKIVFIETAVAMMDTVGYEDGYDDERQAVRTEKLLTDVRGSQDSVLMVAADGFEKTEDYDVFADAFLVVTGDDAPAFRDPELPRGMHVRDLAWFVYGNTAFVSVNQSPNLLGTSSVQDDSGVSLDELIAQLGLAQADTYELQASDGYSVEIAGDNLELGIVFFRDSGEVASVFDGLPRDTAVKDLLVVRVVD